MRVDRMCKRCGRRVPALMTEVIFNVSLRSSATLFLMTCHVRYALVRIFSSICVLSISVVFHFPQFVCATSAWAVGLFGFFPHFFKSFFFSNLILNHACRTGFPSRFAPQECCQEQLVQERWLSMCLRLLKKPLKSCSSHPTGLTSSCVDLTFNFNVRTLKSRHCFLSVD